MWYGPTEMPHIPKLPTYPNCDAMGRIIIEDGIDRLHAGWPPTRAIVCHTAFASDIAFNIVLQSTESLHEFMEKYEMLALCVISEKEVLILSEISYKKLSEKLSEDKIDTTNTASHLLPGPNRLTQAQYDEVVMRLKHNYLDYGIGVMIIDENGFKYHIVVPNRKEYNNYKTEYDEKKRLFSIVNDKYHANAKRTRSGKKYNGSCKN